MFAFECPKCGSPFFRTTSAYDAPVLSRQCRGALVRGEPSGYKYAGCDFTWQSTDDSKYGLGPGADFECTEETE